MTHLRLPGWILCLPPLQLELLWHVASQVTTLALEGNFSVRLISPSVASLLCTLDTLPHLTSLDIHCMLSGAIKQPVVPLFFARLRSLALHAWGSSTAQADADGVRHMLASPHLSALTQLTLEGMSGQYWNHCSWRDVFANLSQLASLTLVNCIYASTLLECLLTRPRPSLRSLYLLPLSGRHSSSVAHLLLRLIQPDQVMALLEKNLQLHITVQLHIVTRVKPRLVPHFLSLPKTVRPTYDALRAKGIASLHFISLVGSKRKPNSGKRFCPTSHTVAALLHHVRQLRPTAAGDLDPTDAGCNDNRLLGSFAVAARAHDFAILTWCKQSHQNCLFAV